ncbi:hypothetical protein U1Q18_026479 [Sarracenia purpurea var. burkii]
MDMAFLIGEKKRIKFKVMKRSKETHASKKGSSSSRLVSTPMDDCSFIHRRKLSYGETHYHGKENGSREKPSVFEEIKLPTLYLPIKGRIKVRLRTSKDQVLKFQKSQRLEEKVESTPTWIGSTP